MPKKRSKLAAKPYDVGYRRPPKQFQFKKGQTGNPEGINRKASGSIVPDLRALLQRALSARVKLRRGERDKVETKAAVGIEQLVDQFAKGDPRARRDLILVCEKFGVDLTNRKALESALDEVLSAEDEALLADFVKRHGGHYPLEAEPDPRQTAKDANFLTASENGQLLPLPSANLISQIRQPEGGSHE